MLVTTPRRAHIRVDRVFRRTFLPMPLCAARVQETINHPQVLVVKSWNDTRETYDSPNWRWRISQGLNATGRLIGYRQQAGLTEGEGVIYRKVGPITSGNCKYIDEEVFRGAVFSSDFSFANVANGSLAYNQALSRFISKARSAQTTLQGGVAMGELRETVGLILQSATNLKRGIFNYLTGAQKLRSVRRDRLAKALADRWLEAQFGWRPLVSDIDDAMKQIATEREFVAAYKFIAADGTNSSFSDSNGGPNYGCVWKVRYIHSINYRLYGTVAVNIPGSQYRDIGMAPDNWLPTIWELLPWSFLVDYFTNVGSFLSGYSFSRSTLRWYSRTYRSTKQKSTHSAYVTDPNTTIKVPGHTYYEILEVDRAAQDPAFLPDIVLEIVPPRRITQLLNMTALAASSAKTRRILSSR